MLETVDIGVVSLTSVEARVVPTRLLQGLVTEHVRLEGERAVAVVRCVAGDLEGFGEAPPLPSFTGDDAASTVAAVAKAGPALIGLPVLRALDRVHEEPASPSSAARAALDIALHDLIGKAVGRPVHELLGQRRHPRLRISRAIGYHTPEEALTLARDYVAQGITALKLKVGRGVAPDVEIVLALRAALGPEIELAIDANEAMSSADAVALARACADAELAYFEQPVPRHDLAGMERVRLEGGVPVLADESVFTAADVRRAAHAGAADLVAVKLVKCGGLRPGLEMARAAAEAGLRCVVIDPLGSAVSLTAGAHLASLLDDPGVGHGLSGGLDVLAGHAPHRAVVRGHVEVPSAPGLGVDVTWPARGGRA